MVDTTPKPKRPLTVKQERFAVEYVRTGNASEAYRLAYDAEGMLPATIGHEATTLLDHPIIATRIIEEKERALAPARASAAWIVSTAADIAENDENPASARVQALSLLSKRHPEFRDVTIDQSQHVHLPEGLSLDELRQLARGDSESTDGQ